MKKIQLGKSGRFALVDEEDFERVSKFKWYASVDSRGTKIYAKRRVRLSELDRYKTNGHMRLHHFVLNIMPCELPEFHVVDHIDHDGLNCQKSNLEIITQRENMMRSKNWKRKKEEPCL